MATVKAKYNYHGSDGYRAAGSTWEVSEDEATALEKFGAVEIVDKEETVEEKVSEKEDKTEKSTKEDKAHLKTKSDK